MIKIVVLNDDRNDNELFEAEHGFSLYIELDNLKLLFDVGQTDIFIDNASKLGIDVNDVDVIILSHGHYDHGNGLDYFKKRVKLVMHPECINYRIRKSTGTYGGINSSLEQLDTRFDLVLNEGVLKLKDNVYVLSNIERTVDFECKKFPMTDKDGKDDKVNDESCVVITTNKGLIVISGCAHSGICNTIEYAKKMTGIDYVYAVIGGFHLREVNDVSEKTINYFIDNGVKYVYPAHCTCDEACKQLVDSKEFKTEIVKVGNSYFFD